MSHKRDFYGIEVPIQFAQVGLKQSENSKNKVLTNKTRGTLSAIKSTLQSLSKGLPIILEIKVSNIHIDRIHNINVTENTLTT